MKPAKSKPSSSFPSSGNAMIFGHGTSSEPDRESILHTGIQLLLSKIPVQDVIGTLGWRIRRLKVQEQAEARVFHSLASYAPAFGMVGTLIGLVNMMLVMKNTSASDLGANWAIALVTTFYGVLLANLVSNPLPRNWNEGPSADYFS